MLDGARSETRLFMVLAIRSTDVDVTTAEPWAPEYSSTIWKDTYYS